MGPKVLAISVILRPNSSALTTIKCQSKFSELYPAIIAGFKCFIILKKVTIALDSLSLNSRRVSPSIDNTCWNPLLSLTPIERC